MSQLITVVDAFAEQPFTGNPAAVCILNAPADEEWMRRVAREMNLSETAFLHPHGAGGVDDGYRLRWFTPTVEIALCGHATLASAHVLWESARLPAGQQARFHTMSGLLTADRQQSDGMIVLDFPATPQQTCPVPAGLQEALGAPMKYVGKTTFDVLVEVDSEQTVRGLTPNHSALAALPVRGVMVTSRSSDPAYDFVSRFFGPGAGIPEDPVTGSAHCCLGPYWGERLDKTDLVGHQVSARGGVVHVGVRGDRVRLGGRAVTVLRGELLA
ncbi:MAG: PhzF family phenazine biosynthesis protein [Polyangia bacterium]